MIKRFLLLNGLATIGVVMNHAAGWGYTALFWWTGSTWLAAPDFTAVGSLPYYGLRTIEQLIIFSIAAFLMVSGFFVAFAARRQASVSWRTVQQRIVYLLLPYLLWSLALFAFNFFQGEFEGKVLPLRQYLTLLIVGGATDGYYYVPMVIQMFLLAPLLVRVARWRWQVLLAVTAVILLVVQTLGYLQIIGAAVPPWLAFWTKSWLFPHNLFWFALGIVVGLNLASFKEWISRWRGVWLATAVLLVPAGIVEWEVLQTAAGQPFLPTQTTMLDSLYAAAVIFAWLAFENANPPQAQELSDLGAKSYGVYLANSPVLDVAAQVIAKVLPVLLAYQILFQPVLWIAGLGIPLLMMAVVSYPKSPIRAYYQYIFG